MKTHSQEFKEQIKKLGRELDSKITYTIDDEEIELGSEQLNSITPHYQGTILKSVMKQLDIDSNVDIPIGTQINAQFGIKIGDEYEYLNYGNYIVYSSEKQEDTRSYKIVAYDKMLYSMVDYVSVGVTYPCTIRDYISAICTHLNLTFKNSSDTFVNYNKEIPNELYLDSNGNSLGYTFRDVLDELSQVTASTICLDENDELEIRYINDTQGNNLWNEQWENGYWNRTTGQKGSGDTYLRCKDYQPITPNTDIYFNKPSEYINFAVIFYDSSKQIINSGTPAYVDSRTYTTPSNASYFTFYLDMGSGTATYNNNIMINYGNEPKDYEPYGDTIDEEYLKNINVNFGEKYGAINTISFKRSGNSDVISKSIPSDLADDLKKEISISDNQILNGNNRDEYIDGILNKLYGLEYYINDYSSTGICYLDLCDKYNVKVDNKYYSCIMFNDEVDITQGLEEKIHTEMPEDSVTDYKKASTTDRRINNVSLIVDKQEKEIRSLAEKVVDVSNTINGIGSVTLVNAHEGILHRLEIVGNLNLLYPEDTLYPSNTLYPLDTYLLVDSDRYKLDIDYLTYTDNEHYDKYVYEDGKQWIERTNGTVVEKEDIEINVKQNSVIRLESFNITLKVVYLLENIYTDTFATQVEVNSEIKQTADEINLEVSKKVNEDEVVSTINQSAEQIKIQANKIALEGYTTINDGFAIDSGGNMIANNGTFNGTINGGEVRITDNYTENDPYIEVGDVLETNVSVKIWNGNVVAYDYTGTSYPRIRTETIDGYAELLGPNCRAFAFENISLEDKKKNFEKLDNAINILNKGDIYTYNWKTEDDNDEKHFGFVIGDKYKTPKEVLSKNKEAIDQYAMVSILWQVCKEQQKEINELKEKIK